MAYVGLALYAEGETDHSFLQPLLRRVVVELLLAHGFNNEVEVTDVQRLLFPAESPPARADRIRDGAVESAGMFHLLFIHADEDGEGPVANENRVQPGKAAVEAALGSNGRSVVAVIPIRETEAWALAHGETLRAVFASDRSDAEMGLPRPSEVERCGDPKTALEHAYSVCRSGRRPPRRAVDFLDLLGDQVPLDRLRVLAAYRQLEEEVLAALVHLGHAPQGSRIV